MTDRTGMFFLISKHWLLRKGKKGNRRFFLPDKMPDLIALGKEYASKNDEDYLIVMVISEVSAPPTQPVGDGTAAALCPVCGGLWWQTKYVLPSGVIVCGVCGCRA